MPAALQYSLCRANLPIVEIVCLHLGHWRFIKPIIIVTNAAPYVIKIRLVGLCLKRAVYCMTNLMAAICGDLLAILITNYNGLLLLNCKLNTLSSILS